MCWAMPEYDCGKSIYMNDVFLLYYWGGDNDCYNLTKETKQFLLILINQYVEILLISVYSKIYHPSTYTQIVIKILFNFFSQSIRMSGKNINFEDKKIKKSDFYKNKKVTTIDDIDVNKILVSKEELYEKKNLFKYFIGYNDNDVIMLLCIKLPQMTGHVRKSEGNTTISFQINCKQLLKK